MTLRIVHAASGREWRGGERQVWLLARELARGGDLDQIVVTARGSELARRVRADGIPVHETPWRAGLDPRAVPALVRALKPGASLLHAHDAHAVTLGGVAARLTRRPYVATRRVDFRLRRQGLWAGADRVIAISHAVADVLRADGISPARIALVHSGIDLGELRRTARLGVRQALRLAPQARIAANVAALVGHKDHATLVRAASLLVGRCPDLHWVVAGEGPLRGSLERLRADLGLEGRVHFLGHLAEPTGLIADADVFVMSSREEGLGTSVLDAMGLGIPVASTSAGGLPEMLQDGAGLLVTPGRPDELAAAVARLIDDSALARATAARASATVARFTAGCMAEAVRQVYRSCVPFP